jgi:hypothetical protein
MDVKTLSRIILVNYHFISRQSSHGVDLRCLYQHPSWEFGSFHDNGFSREFVKDQHHQWITMTVADMQVFYLDLYGTSIDFCAAFTLHPLYILLFDIAMGNGEDRAFLGLEG